MMETVAASKAPSGGAAVASFLSYSAMPDSGGTGNEEFSLQDINCYSYHSYNYKGCVKSGVPSAKVPTHYGV